MRFRQSVLPLALGLTVWTLLNPIPGVAQTTFIDDYVPQPGFTGQTRAPLATQCPRLVMTTVASGLMHAWGFEFLPDGRILLTERPGRMRILDLDGTLGDPIEGLPPIRAYSGNGL